MSLTNLTGQVVPFAYGATTVRTITIDDEPWFVLADLCAVLGLSSPHKVFERIADDAKGRTSIPTLGGAQNMAIVNEAGMYEVVIRSDKPEAVKFRRWITSEVLPEIRRTGHYGIAPSAPAIPQTYAEALRAAADQADRADVAERKVAQLEPKAEFYDELMDADGTYTFAAVARILGWGRNVMMRELRRLGVLQPNNLPYRRYDHHFQVTPGTYTNRKTGETVPTATTTVRPSGLEFLRKKLAPVSVQLELNGVDA